MDQQNIIISLNNITVEFRCSDLEKSLITTDSRELLELIARKQRAQAERSQYENQRTDIPKGSG